ncbi:MAG: histidine kinase [Chitinophagaceae bacterium]|nr:histidine kinase [Chitinophagaceae bacterium]
MKMRFIPRRWIAIFLHVALWSLFIFYPYIIRHSFGNPNAESARLTHFEIHNFINNVTWIILFYVNAFVLMPLYFNKKKYRQYTLVIFVALVVLSFVNWLTFRLLLPQSQFKLIGLLMFYLIPTCFILLWSIAYRILVDRFREDKSKAEKQAENLTTELAFLRSQVSPHFMFNVMNNMVALARKKSELLEPSLIKLSSLLRYMLYETDEEKVSLQKEIEYLQSYIALQKQRFAENVLINVSLDSIDGNLQIHPMLLIPFVENAFKHGSGMFTPEINVDLKTNDGRLFLEVSNWYAENGEVKDKSSGIGLVNVTRRLNLLYGANHKLDISRNANRFTVKLEIVLV